MQRACQATTRIVKRAARSKPRHLSVDICVVGAGIAGSAAALQAARLGRRVVIIDGLPALGGQAVNSIISTFCGLFSNGTHGYQFTYGIADDILGDWPSSRTRSTTGTVPTPRSSITMRSRLAAGSRRHCGSRRRPVVGAVLREVTVEGRRIAADCATRYGDVDIEAAGFVDATGDAALAWNAGLPCREPADGKVFGTQMVILEGIDEGHAPQKPEISARMKDKAGDYGLRRREGFAFIIPGRGVAAMNMTHVETPLDPLELPPRRSRARTRPTARSNSCGPSFPSLRPGPSPRLWLSRHPPDALDQGRAPAHHRGGALRHQVR